MYKSAQQEKSLLESRIRKTFYSRMKFALTLKYLMKYQPETYAKVYNALSSLVDKGFLLKAVRGNSNLYIINPSYRKPKRSKA